MSIYDKILNFAQELYMKNEIQYIFLSGNNYRDYILLCNKDWNNIETHIDTIRKYHTEEQKRIESNKWVNNVNDQYNC
jgi:hypothetical protein